MSIRMVLVAGAVVAGVVLASAPAGALAGPTAARSGYVETTTSDPVTAAPPVAVPPTAHCTVTLARHALSNAADGTPIALSGRLRPPADCPGPWAKVVLSETISVSGRQYDRVGTLTIGTAEVYHGTTAEPSGSHPTTYRFQHDLTEYSALLRTDQPFHGGIVNYTSDVYTGVYDQTVAITYYRADRRHPAPRTPDVVVGLGESALSPTAPTAEPALGTLPRNLTGGYLRTTLEGSGCDEQWFSAVPDQLAARFPDAGLCAHGPYREADLALDGRPVGAVHTFPHIYSGGIVPTLWRPIPAIDTFDLHSETVDITPFAGLLVDGGDHRLRITMPGLGDGWTVTATVFLYTDHHRARTSGALTTDRVAASAPVTTRISTAEGGGRATVTARRADITAGFVDTSAGRITTTVTRTMDYRNVDAVTDAGSTQDLVQSDRGGQRVNTVGPTGIAVAEHRWDYPLTVHFSAADYVDDQNFSLSGTVDMTKRLVDTAVGAGRRPVLRASVETLHSTGILARADGQTSQSDGRSTSTFAGTDDAGRPYWHRLASAHGVVTEDRSASR